MLFESLNGPKEPDKSFVERADEDLVMSQQALLTDGTVVTAKAGLKAFLFYRDHRWNKQGRRTDNSNSITVTVNNPRKRHVIS